MCPNYKKCQNMFASKLLGENASKYNCPFWGNRILSNLFSYSLTHSTNDYGETPVSSALPPQGSQQLCRQTRTKKILA